MNRFFLFLTAFAFMALQSHAQNCTDGFYSFSEGSSWELTNFNAKGSSTGRSSYKISNVTGSGASFKGMVHSATYNEKDKELAASDFEVSCANGDILIDMKSMITEQQQQQFKDMTMKMSGDALILPKTLSVGQTLADGTLKADIYSGNSLFGTLSYVASERKVLAKESVTVPAGTFECYKITSKINSVTTMAGIPIKFEFTVIEWYAYGTGLVRSEIYNKSGNLSGYSILSKLTK